MKLMNLLLILIVIMLQGCSVPVKLNQDSAPLADQDIVKHGTLAENYSRIIIYSGKVFSKTISFDLNRSIDILIDNKKIGVIGNKEEMIAIDLPKNTYSLKCKFSEIKDNSETINSEILTLDINTSNILYFKVNYRSKTPATAALLGGLGAGAFAKYSIVLEQDDPDAGKVNIENHKLVLRHLGISEKLVDGVNYKQSNTREDEVEMKISKLKQMFDGKLITKEEYDSKRKQLIEKF